MSAKQLDYWSALRWAIALVWFYQGAWLKVIAVDTHHLSIIDSAIHFGSARFWMACLGVFETMLGVWFITQWKCRLCGVIQILLLIGMNTGGIIFAADQIPDAPGMVFMNLVFVLAIAGAGDLWRSKS